MPQEAPPFHVATSPGGREVSVWSAYRLQFDAKPATRALKGAIGEAVATLSARDGEMLEAVYVSDARDVVDCENVLLYNVGSGRFAAAARHGLRCERVHAPAPPSPRPLAAPAAHHHRYRLVARDAPSRHWRPERRLLGLQRLRFPRVRAEGTPDEVWLATRLRLGAILSPHDSAFALRVRLQVPNASTARITGSVKPLVDGLVSALHEHDGSMLAHVSASIARRLGRPQQDIMRLLIDHPGALLGPRRLVHPWRTSHQWNPADDRCVSFTVLVEPGAAGPEWTADVEVHAVRPTG